MGGGGHGSPVSSHLPLMYPPPSAHSAPPPSPSPGDPADPYSADDLNLLEPFKSTGFLLAVSAAVSDRPLTTPPHQSIALQTPDAACGSCSARVTSGEQPARKKFILLNKEEGGKRGKNKFKVIHHEVCLLRETSLTLRGQTAVSGGKLSLH